MVLPGNPTAGLIIGHAQGGLGILESALDPIAIGMLPDHCRQGHRPGSVAQKPFPVTAFTVDGTDRPPAASLGLLAVPYPDPLAGRPHRQGSAGAFTNLDFAPALMGK